MVVSYGFLTGVFPLSLDKIPVEVLKHAFYRSGGDAAELANNMGWFHTTKVAPDSSRALRTIGLRPMREAKNGLPTTYRTTLKYDLAVELIEALHYDPCDYGL